MGDGDGVADAAITAPTTVTYELVATNDGNVTLTDVKIVDPDIATRTCVPASPAVLAQGESITCTGDVALDQADIDAGGDHVNVATVESKYDGHRVLGRAVYDIPIGTSPSLVLTKTSTSHPDGDGDGVADAALTSPATVTYRLVATNDGNVTLDGVTVTDPDVSGLSCTPTAPAQLAPGASITCTGTRTLTQADVDGGGDHVNIATATASVPGGGSVSDRAAYDIPIDRSPAVTITKTPAGQQFTVGDTPTITWTITVRNTGNVTLSDVVVDDGLVVDTSGDLTPLASCGRTYDTLAPGASRTIPCSTTRTIVLAEIANHVTASATSPIGPIEAQAVAIVRSEPATTTTTTPTTTPPTTTPVTPTTPTTTPTPGAGVPSSTIPATGGSTESSLVIGVLLVIAGVATLGVAHRPRRRRGSASWRADVQV